MQRSGIRSCVAPILPDCTQQKGSKKGQVTLLPDPFFRLCLTVVIMHIYDVLYFVHLEITMKQATFTEVRNHAKQYFDIVESGETVRVLRNGKPIADIVPVVPDLPSWKRRKAQPLVLDGVSVSRMILEEREAGI